jgi:putative hydrolase of the HAD superfamily
LKIKAVMFDAVGTLIYANPPVAEVYHGEGLRHGSQLPASEVQDRLKHFIPLRLYQNDLGGRSHETSQAELVRRWQSIVRDVFDDMDDTSSIFADLWHHFAQPSSWALYPDVASTLHALRDADIDVGVASNFDDRLDRLCDELRLVGDVSRVFHSARLGIQKPAIRFFRKIESALLLRPDQLVMVGDDWQDDYQAAQLAGWHSRWLKREGPAAHASELTSLRQVLDVIA